MYEQTQVYRLDGLSDDGIHTLMAGVVGSQRDHALADRLLHQVRACMKAGIQAVLVCVDGWLAYVHSIERAFREKIAHTKQGKPVVSRASNRWLRVEGLTASQSWRGHQPADYTAQLPSFGPKEPLFDFNVKQRQCDFGPARDQDRGKHRVLVDGCLAVAGHPCPSALPAQGWPGLSNERHDVIAA